MALPQPAQPPTTSLPFPHPEAYPGEPREYARALMQRKDDIEKEIEVLKNVLASHGTTSSTPLVDPEGFPRSDIDIYAIRHARSQLAHLQTDRQTVSDLLAQALPAAFAPNPNPNPSSHPHPNPNPYPNSNQTSQANGSKLPSSSLSNGHRYDPTAPARNGGGLPDEWPERGIVRVNTVASGSPAEEAGLRSGDLIHSFAGVTAESGGGLQAIGALVSRSEGVSPILALTRL